MALVRSLLAKGAYVDTRRVGPAERAAMARQRFLSLVRGSTSESATEVRQAAQKDERDFEANQARQRERAVQAQALVATEGSIVAPEVPERRISAAYHHVAPTPPRPYLHEAPEPRADDAHRAMPARSTMAPRADESGQHKFRLARDDRGRLHKMISDEHGIEFTIHRDELGKAHHVVAASTREQHTERAARPVVHHHVEAHGEPPAARSAEPVVQRHEVAAAKSSETATQLQALTSHLQDAVRRLEGMTRAVSVAPAAQPSGPAHGEPPEYEMLVTHRDLNNRPHRILLRPTKAKP